MTRGERRGDGGRAGRGQQRDPQRDRQRQRGGERREQQAGGSHGSRQHDGGREQDGRERGERDRRQGTAQCESQCGGEGEPVAAQPSVEHAVVIAARSDAGGSRESIRAHSRRYSQDPPKKVLNP